MKPNKKHTKHNKNSTRNTKASQNQKKGRKELYIPGLFNKPSIELVGIGLPLTIAACPDTNGDEPTLVDKEYCGRVYTVTDGSYYTARMGIHSNSLGIAAMNEDCAVVCVIPTIPDETQRLMALFFIPEIDPIKFMDVIWLRAENGQRFRLEYVYGSAALEPNSDAHALPLRHEAITEEDDYTIILQNRLDGEIPAFCTFSYDFLRFQVKVIYVG